MILSLRALLEGVIDYAGMFPPARLPWEESLARYARDARSADAWMLRRFVCAANILEELPGHDAWGKIDPLRLAVVCAAAEELEPTLEAIARLKSQRRISIALEFKPPLTTDASVEDLRSREWFALLERAGSLCDETYLELDIGQLNVIRTRRSELPTHWRWKFRTGGAEPTSFPTATELAWTIVGCRAGLVRWKATAGLHHPLPGPDPSLGVRAHGFLNLLVAAALTHARGLGPEEVEAILAEESATAFVFDQRSLCWNDKRADLDEIRRARRDFFVSFGSCSFDEPREDLRALGLL